MTAPNKAFKRHPLPPPPPPGPAPRPDRPEPTAAGASSTSNHPGSRYTAAEVEFIRAVEAFQKRTGRKFLASVDYLRILLGLGYTRPAPKKPKKPSAAAKAPEKPR
jgi:hypothetical protein